MTKRLIPILLILFLVSCDNILPFPSRWGENTFGCKVEGIAMKTSSEFFRDNPIYARMTDSSLFISASDYNDDLYISISLDNIRKKGTYLLDNINGGAFYLNGKYPASRYETYNGYGGKVHITRFDVKNKIVSGTFSFKAVKFTNSTSHDTTTVVEVKGGRFDIDLNKLGK